MAIHDISLGVDRMSPARPNTHDKINQGAISAHGTNSVNYVSDASDLDKVADALNGQQTIVGSMDITTSVVTSAGAGAGAFSTELVNGATVAHGLDYIPSVIAFYGSSSTIFGQMPSLNYNAVSTASALWYAVRVTSDATNIKVDFRFAQFGRDSVSLPPLNIKVYLLQQTPN